MSPLEVHSATARTRGIAASGVLTFTPSIIIAIRFGSSPLTNACNAAVGHIGIVPPPPERPFKDESSTRPARADTSQFRATSSLAQADQSPSSGSPPHPPWPREPDLTNLIVQNSGSCKVLGAVRRQPRRVQNRQVILLSSFPWGSPGRKVDYHIHLQIAC